VSLAHVALIVLLAGTFALGILHVSLARPLFVLGAAIVGYLAWCEKPARCIECAIVLFALAPLLRRVVDYGVGYDESGFMLLGPLLAIIVPTVELRHLLYRRTVIDTDLGPVVLLMFCLSYALVLSTLEGDVLQPAITLVKRLTPLLFGVWVMLRAREDDGILAAAARAFLIVTPIMGIYGLLQYLSPLPWDRYWMVYSKMDSIGSPEPMQVRVFSTMNSPGSYATFTACGLLIFGFCRQGWQAVLFALPATLGLLLTLYRTAWITLAIGILYCAFFTRTRGRAGLITVFIGLAAVFAASATEFGDIITDRLATLGGSVAEDGSGRARLDQFYRFYEELDHTIFGSGLAVGQTGARTIDGEVAAALLEMGLLIGPLYMTSLIWAAAQALGRIGRRDAPTRLVVGAGLAGILSQMPLAGITAGETGFLFWMLIGLATCASDRYPGRAIWAPQKSTQRDQ
jgi:hypothetical protein